MIIKIIWAAVFGLCVAVGSSIATYLALAVITVPFALIFDVRICDASTFAFIAKAVFWLMWIAQFIYVLVWKDAHHGHGDHDHADHGHGHDAHGGEHANSHGHTTAAPAHHENHGHSHH